MDIFENLENLNVSEECFNDIIDIIEGFLNGDSLDDGSHIRKRYGEPEYKEGKDSKGFEIPANKSAKLYAKAHSKDDKYPYAPAFNDGKGVGEYGKRVSYSSAPETEYAEGDKEQMDKARAQQKLAKKMQKTAKTDAEKDEADKQTIRASRAKGQAIDDQVQSLKDDYKKELKRRASLPMRDPDVFDAPDIENAADWSDEDMERENEIYKRENARKKLGDTINKAMSRIGTRELKGHPLLNTKKSK